jgi:hypothetical protein
MRPGYRTGEDDLDLHRTVQPRSGGDMAKRKSRNPHLVEPTWGQSVDGGPPLTELTSEAAGPLSPFGEDHSFPLPIDRLRYAHPTDKPNRAGVQLVDE